jgi:hypothetical protein
MLQMGLEEIILEQNTATLHLNRDFVHQTNHMAAPGTGKVN